MTSQPESFSQEVLAGLVERVTYHNVENGFCVMRTSARGHRAIVTVVGYAAAVNAGEWITASGQWVNDRTHVQQFRARLIACGAPIARFGCAFCGVGVSIDNQQVWQAPILEQLWPCRVFAPNPK